MSRPPMFKISLSVLPVPGHFYHYFPTLTVTSQRDISHKTPLSSSTLFAPRIQRRILHQLNSPERTIQEIARVTLFSHLHAI